MDVMNFTVLLVFSVCSLLNIFKESKKSKLPVQAGHEKNWQDFTNIWR
jgi:hypothetical protein